MFERRSFSREFFDACKRGFRRMSPEAGRQLCETIAASQGPGGFFYDRSGREDLYYTHFGVLLAGISGAKFRRKDCAAKLHSLDFPSLDLVHACSWLRVSGMLRFLSLSRFAGTRIGMILTPFFERESVRKFRSLSLLSERAFPQRAFPQQAFPQQAFPQQAFPQQAFPQQDPGAPYSRFLLGTLAADFGGPAPEFDPKPYRLPNGLFRNLRHHSDYGTNATAAALFLLPKNAREQTALALSALQEMDGPFKATASAPEGDLMSTATAAFALQQCGISLGKPVERFLRDCFRDDGLFAATPSDPGGDLEYTTYGLLLMGVIS